LHAGHRQWQVAGFIVRVIGRSKLCAITAAVVSSLVEATTSLTATGASLTGVMLNARVLGIRHQSFSPAEPPTLNVMLAWFKTVAVQGRWWYTSAPACNVGGADQLTGHHSGAIQAQDAFARGWQSVDTRNAKVWSAFNISEPEVSSCNASRHLQAGFARICASRRGVVANIDRQRVAGRAAFAPSLML
jgi:hypothetical protein